MLFHPREFILAAATIAAMPAVGPALSQQQQPQQQQPTGPQCAKRADVIETLHKQFGERLAGRGLASNSMILELYVGPSDTWTVIATSTAGVSCILVGGEAWDAIKAPGNSAGLPLHNGASLRPLKYDHGDPIY